MNIRRHGVRFSDAVGVFSDVSALTLADDEHGEGEDRFVITGADIMGRVLVVVFTWRADRIRIISARVANRNERKQYESTT